MSRPVRPDRPRRQPRTPRRGGGRQLPRRARHRADDLDAARLLRGAAASCASSRSRGSARRSTSASTRSRTRSTPPSAPRPRPTQLLAEYRERLKEARVAGRRDRRARAQGRRGPRARVASEAGAPEREELLEQTRRDIEAETRRAIQEIRSEVADLTILATEKVTRKTLTERGPAAPRRGGARRARLLARSSAETRR